MQLPGEGVPKADGDDHVADVSGRLPQGARLQLPVPREGGGTGAARVQGFRPVLRWAALSARLREGVRWADELVAGYRYLLRPAEEPGAVLVRRIDAGRLHHAAQDGDHAEQGVQGDLRVLEFVHKIR